MTTAEENRLAELCTKMETAKAMAGRTYTDTADLDRAEQLEFRWLQRRQERLQAAWNELQDEARNRSMLSSFMPHDEY